MDVTTTVTNIGNTMNEEEISGFLRVALQLLEEERKLVERYGDPTMRITHQEKTRALQIKAAVEADPRLINLTDFEYVQYALTSSKDNEEPMEAICERVYLQQEFQRQYQLDGTHNQALLLVYVLTLLQPGLLLAVAFLPPTHNYITVLDLARFVPARVEPALYYRVFVGAFYYILQSMSSNFHAIRAGLSFMVECKDSSMDQNYQEHFLETLAAQFLHYPANLRETYLLNSETVANVSYGLLKRQLAPETQQRVFLGQRIGEDDSLNGQRIDVLYSTPTFEAAQNRMLLQFLQYFLERNIHKEKFSLQDNAMVVDIHLG